MLSKAIADYLEWMISAGYADSTWNNYQRALDRFEQFVQDEQLVWDDIFTWKTLQGFCAQVKMHYAGHAVRGLARYLFGQGLIKSPIYKEPPPLPEVFEDYVRFYKQTRQVGYLQIYRVRSTLSALKDYLQDQGIGLKDFDVFHMDSFLAKRNASYAPETRINQRSVLRGFLRYLYQERGILGQDLSALIQGPPAYAQSSPPKFLTPDQIQKLFQSIDVLHPKGLRTRAMIHLAFSLGLRPKEICQVSLDDISFPQKEIRIPDRKNDIPAILPLSRPTIKALAAYIAWDRPKDPGHRVLLCSTHPPYGPLAPMTVSLDIRKSFQKAGIKGSAYWLRHTYAQNLLQTGASIFEIKEMLGHDIIKTSRKYLSVHTKLMREVLFDEEI
ncbi:MAG: tyrosine-type recombinase/integrase [Desulfovermiculus sp.]|nr:tyrosine-type recombinase/integrase [Desulfovermiculus sp.]